MVKRKDRWFRKKGRSNTAAFLADDRGSISNEWLISIAIVVMMAVPVMAVISGSSEQTGQDIVVSIEDADSFGGRGYDGKEADVLAEILESEEDFVPGADMGVGFPVAENGEVIETSPEGYSPVDPDRLAVLPQTVNTPRFYAEGAGGRVGGRGAGRLGEGGSPGARRSGGGSSLPSGGSPSGIGIGPSNGISIPTAPDGVIRAALPPQLRNEFEFLSKHCVDYVAAHESAIAEMVQQAQAELDAGRNPHLVTSGR